MAAANPPPPAPGQQQQQQQQQHIDTLQTMLNLIFLHSGRFLKETQTGGGSGRMKQQLQRVVPHATERFHDALDELENEVRLAQMVLRRDMALLRQDRKKKEAAAKQQEVDKARLAAEARNPPPPTNDAPVKEEKAATPAQLEPPAVLDTSEQAMSIETDMEAAKKEGGNGDHDGQNNKAPSPPQNSTDANIQPPKDPLFDGTPPANNPNESDFDFDAMFGDAMDTTDQNHDHDMMDTSGDIDFGLDSGNDGSSLLRGLEDFAKNSDNDNNNQSSTMDMDFTMPDLPGLDSNTNANTDSNANATTKPAPEPASAPKADEPASAPKADEPKPAAQPPPPQENKVEEAMNNNNNNDDMMGTMAADDLEDLFNMDDYANPEQSSFDDAFFNFE
ncbi:hypothetical protein COCMIDRAFT_86172 [Bipolaris oryzae ATCC 44560]|uniref:Uncharacterized protein n=1 Tax=Bipolaris oryzae ATCC 44560 TaxID=930090 RepID=W6ZFQ5_COCMI|nr:uncharacterized protein COCMIDRAFT_86172 [Bipolaris oryzae ATCC 44560]EUC48860.1 hypothetical protein COCMIDRAFT_86172 [Bipolaris oryzae ATCC 44560]